MLASWLYCSEIVAVVDLHAKEVETVVAAENSTRQPDAEFIRNRILKTFVADL
jgi:hypothetical protein